MKFGLGCLLFLSAAAAQNLGLGVKGGVPFTDVLETSRSFGSQTFQAKTNRYTVGPTLEIRLPFGLSVEFDALYKRFEQNGSSVTGGTVAKTGSSWEFPLLGKYHFGQAFTKPYVEAGISFKHLSGYLLPFRSLPAPPAVQPIGSTTRAGLAVGAGVEFQLHFLRISPGIRFSHWGEQLFVPGTNAVDFLIGASF
jgi:opacity protein-like surface antigen